MRAIQKILVSVSIIGALLGSAGSVHAHSAEATDAAFGALLSMPGAKPTEGRWVIPDEYASEPAGESELIARLQALKRQGADFNALRHRGTLLAHAIRAGLDHTALWLLRHGADPKHVLFSDVETAYDLSRRYQRSAVVKVLEEVYGYKAPNTLPATTTASAAKVRPTAPSSRVEEALALMNTLMRPYPDKAAQQAWQRFASTLSQAEFAAVFKDGANLDELIRLVRDTDGGLEDALSRLPLAVVRQRAQQIADLMAEGSYVTYGDKPSISYSAAARAWPALWRRIEQALRYDSRPDLAGRIPPALWPGLFASGYARHDAAVTGCLLATVDLKALKVLWPDFQRFFIDAREQAPALVLGKYRLSREQSACYYASNPAETVAKLAFLRELGVESKAAGLSQYRLVSEENPALTAMVSHFLPTSQTRPRLVETPPRCELAMNDRWLNALVKSPAIGSGIPAQYVQAIEVPGQGRCGLVVSGESYSDRPESSDNFDSGPSREGSTRCADQPDDSEIWIEQAGRIHGVKTAFETSGGNIVRQVVDTQSGKTYLLNAGKRGAMCALSWALPDAYEWQAGVLHPASDPALIDRLLSEQCDELEQGAELTCRGFVPFVDNPAPQGEAVLAALRNGMRVEVHSLIDALGDERRQAYTEAIMAHDHAAHRALIAAGIPAHWTAEEIKMLGDLSLAERRKRIALLFSDRAQLDRALNSDRYDVLRALLPWLPGQDWGPALRVIGSNPDIWLDAAGRLRSRATEAGRHDLVCDIDRVQGFLCGGGIELD